VVSESEEGLIAESMVAEAERVEDPLSQSLPCPLE
jgi:hypothetical protein